MKVPFAEHPRCNPIFETENNIPVGTGHVSYYTPEDYRGT